MEGGAVVQLWLVLYGFPNENREKLMACCKCEEHKWDDPQPVVYTDPEGKGYCLFHAPAKHKGMSVDEFNQQIYNRIGAAKRTGSSCNLSGVIFPGDISFSRFKKDNPLPEIDFEGAIFEGSARFNSTYFNENAYFKEITAIKKFQFTAAICGGDFYLDGAVFCSDAYFDKVKFKGVCSLNRITFESSVFWTNSTFSEKVEFNEISFNSYCIFDDVLFCKESNFKSNIFNKTSLSSAIFNGDVEFYESTFTGHALFINTQFNSNACFGNIDFERLALFDETTFNGEVSFYWCHFSNKVLFDRVKFKSIADFNNIDFDRNTEFKSIVCMDRVEFHTVFFNNAYLRTKTNTPGLHFIQCTAGLNGLNIININLSECSFLYSDMTNIHFLQSTWPTKSGRYHMLNEDVENPDWQGVGDFYKRMKRKYKAENDEYEASKWHIAEKEAQLKLLGKAIQPMRDLVRQAEDSGGVKALWRALTQQQDKTFFAAFERCLKSLSNAVAERLTFRALWLYKYSSGYGERPARALFWLGVLVGISVFLPGDMRGYIPLMKQVTPPEALAGASLFQSFGRIGWQLIITIQAALFAFALRNNFRR